jgi:hypothetical protein
LAGAAFLSLCTTPGSAQDPDAKAEAKRHPSRAHCAFGAESPRLAARCAEVNFGAEGLMAIARAVNREALASAAGRPLLCTDHVALVRRRMAEYPDYTLREIYSCDAEPVVKDGRPVCHVSLLVSSAGGAQVVLDNGHVLEPASTGGVAAYREFALRVDRHWVGAPPPLLAAPAQPQEAGAP